MEYELNTSKKTAEELYMQTPIGVLRYITALENEIEQLSLCSVTQQRELLLAYHRYLTEELSLDLHEIWVNEHLKANNSG